MSMRTTGQPNFSQIRDGLARVDAELDVFDADRLPEPAEPSL